MKLYCSHLFAPEENLLLLEVPSFLFIDQYEVEEVPALKPVVHVFVGRRQVCTRQIKTNRDTLAFDRSSIHYFKLVEIFGLGDRILSAAHYLLLDNTEFHMFDLDAHQVEKYFAENAVLEVEFALVEFKLDVKALFNSNFHLNGSIHLWFLPTIRH
jgi:hypothetical protein